jgi:hypothetical protein
MHRLPEGFTDALFEILESATRIRRGLASEVDERLLARVLQAVNDGALPSKERPIGGPVRGSSRTVVEDFTTAIVFADLVEHLNQVPARERDGRLGAIAQRIKERHDVDLLIPQRRASTLRADREAVGDSSPKPMAEQMMSAHRGRQARELWKRYADAVEHYIADERARLERVAGRIGGKSIEEVGTNWPLGTERSKTDDQTLHGFWIRFPELKNSDRRGELKAQMGRLAALAYPEPHSEPADLGRAQLGADSRDAVEESELLAASLRKLLAEMRVAALSPFPTKGYSFGPTPSEKEELARDYVSQIFGDWVDAGSEDSVNLACEAEAPRDPALREADRVDPSPR